MSSSVDLRGFSYQLEPILQRTQWEIDALQMRLGLSLRALEECQSSLRDMEAKLGSQVAALGVTWQARLDPQSYQQGLLFLAQRKQDIETQRKTLESLQENHMLIQKECVVKQQKIELIQSHRNECLDDFMVTQTNLQSSEADRDWNARSTWREKHTENLQLISEATRGL